MGRVLHYAILFKYCLKIRDQDLALLHIYKLMGNPFWGDPAGELAESLGQGRVTWLLRRAKGQYRTTQKSQKPITLLSLCCCLDSNRSSALVWSQSTWSMAHQVATMRAILQASFALQPFSQAFYSNKSSCNTPKNLNAR